MTKEHIKELLPIMQAWVDGCEIQSLAAAESYTKWIDYVGNDPDFGNPNLLWRVKPNKKHFWIVNNEAFSTEEKAKAYREKLNPVLDILHVIEY